MEWDCVTGIIFLPHRSLSKTTTTAWEDKFLLQERNETRSWAQRQPFSSADTFITAAHLEFFHFWHSTRFMQSLYYLLLLLMFILLMSSYLSIAIFHPLFCLTFSLSVFLSLLAWYMGILPKKPLHTTEAWMHIIQQQRWGKTAGILILCVLLCSLKINCKVIW